MSSFHASAKVLNFIDTRPKDNEVKGAVQLNPNIQQFLNADRVRKNTRVQLGEKSVPCSTFAIFDKQEDNLADFVNRLSNQLGQSQGNATGTEDAYGLMFEDGRRFVTEQNKHLIQQGFLLILTASPTNYARSFLVQLTRFDLRCDVSAMLADLALFSSLAADIAFANALKAVGGIKQLIDLIENGTFETNVTVLCQMLQILLVLMGHADVVSAEDFSRRFIEKIAIYVNGSSKIENNDSLHLSLNLILDVMKLCNYQLKDALKEEVKFETLIRHLENSDERILLSALTLMTSIYAISDGEEKQSIVKILHSKPFVAAIETGITRESRSPDQRIRAQLVQIQEILMEELRNLAIRPPTEQEIDYIMEMEEWDPKLSLLKFGGTLLRHESSTILGGGMEMDTEFPLHIDETQLAAQRAADAAAFRKIVQNAPPGLLAIDAILDFSRPKGFPTSTRLKEIQSESLLRVSIWPFIMANLAKSLIASLGICSNKKNPDPLGGNDFSQLILKSERPFYDVFAIAVELFHRTWREMHANFCDLDKVISVVDDQIRRVIAMNPASRWHLNELLEKKFSYYQMQKIWERERIEQEELELNSDEIKALKEHLRPEIEQLVMERKKSFLQRGMVLTKFSFGKSQGKEIQQQQQHWKLDDNERFFCYSDCKTIAGGNQVELDLTTSKKLSIFNIKNIVYGSSYGNQLSQQLGVKLKKNQSNWLLRCGFRLDLAGDGQSMSTIDQSSGFVSDQIHLAANNEADFNAWIEGTNCLITPNLAVQTPSIASEEMQAETATIIRKLVYTTTPPSSTFHRCVTVIDRFHAASYRHSGHQSFQKEDQILLYNVHDPSVKILTMVLAISDEYDFIVFKTTEGPFPVEPRGSDSAYQGQNFIEVTVTPKREIFFKHGIIAQVKKAYCIGSSHGEAGDSGSGVFDDSGRVLGIVVRKKDLQFKSKAFSPMDVADHFSDVLVVPSAVLFSNTMPEEDDDFPPCYKKSRCEEE